MAATPIPFCDETACRAAGCVPTLCTGAGVRSNAELYERSARAIPGGVNSSIRAFKAVGGSPYIVARAEGAHVVDVEGNRYVDLVQSYGAVILGHAHPAVTAALRAAASDGTSYGAPTPREMKLAEAISSRVASCEQVRLMNSGTEATSTAIRLARGATGRKRIVTFSGNFHGATDALLAAGGSGVATLGLPGTAGVPDEAVANTIVAPYNVVPTLDDRVAAVIVEPVAANMGVVAPSPGFLAGLRRECDRVGALLIFDEVITGFRLGPGGAQEKYDVRPDLTCFGKVIGGGLPIGAVGGRREVMATLSPIGKVFHAGTLAGNPLATAAGLAALNELTDDVYMELAARARRLASMLRDACAAADIPTQFPVVGTLVGMFFGDAARGGLPVNFDDAKKTDESLYARFFHAMLAEGVALEPGAYEALFVGVGHDDVVLDDLVERVHRAA
ncbi:MAG: aminotransferase class III-fold pyridoxal phosphate-dependent enzyme, partial [Ilumatobacteraceae bacterium]|nr:aminotransferase class III-fold pyridoxal phosphate-dependent enzyme [Ilumatobacteraceae bacterium]